MSARLVFGIVDAGAYERAMFVSTTATTTHSNTLATPWKQLFLICGICGTCGTSSMLLAIWDDSFFNFFSWFDELAKT